MGSVEDTLEEKANWHWRNTMRPVRFFSLDARAVIPYLILLVFARPITLFLAIVSTAIFIMLEKRGLAFDSAMRALRSWLVGQKRPAWISLRRRRMVDFG